MKNALRIILILITAVAIIAAILLRGLLALTGFGVKFIGSMAARIN